MALEDTGSPSSGGWLFGGDTGLTYEQLKQRRAIAAALASKSKPFPKTRGEGLTYLGESVGDALYELGTQRREAELMRKQAGLLGGAPPTSGATYPTARPGGGVPSAPARIDNPPAPAVSPPASPSTPAPATPPAGTSSTYDASDPVQLASFGDVQNTGTLYQPAGYSPDQDTAEAPPAPLPAAKPEMVANLASMSTPSRPFASTPVSTPDVPLPMGDPRSQGGVKATMDAVLSRGGLDPNAIAGVKMNVRDESGFNPNLRHPDQPNFSGEARYAHGLYQEGGDEWNNYVKWIDTNYPGSDWRDPKLQSQFLADRLNSPQYASTLDRMQGQDRPGVAADAFLRGYLKPAAGPMAQRSAEYLGDRTPGIPAPADNRDAIATALLQAGTQAPDTGPSGSEALLPDVAGVSPSVLPVSPKTASLGRAGVASDALPSLPPMGAGAATGASGTRAGVVDALMNQQTPVPAPEGVPLADPTSPGSIAPVLASTTTGSSTPTVSSDEPPNVQPGITPLPVQVAEAQKFTPSGIPISSDATLGNNRALGPPGTLPSQQPVPPTNTSAYPDPGPEPRRAGPVPISQEQQRWGNLAKNPYLSPEQQAQALQMYQQYETQRLYTQQRQDEDYKTLHDDWMKKVNAAEEWKLKFPERQLTEQGQRLDIQQKSEALAAGREKQALTTRFGGIEPSTMYANLDKEKVNAQSASSQLEQNRMLLSALKSGAITGWGADLRVDIAKMQKWMFDNKIAGDLASATEMLRSAGPGAVGAAIKQLQPGDTRVTEGDVKLAKTATPTDPNLEHGTIIKLLEASNRLNNRIVNDYEDKREIYLGGKNPLASERQYIYDSAPTAPQEYTDRLLKNRTDQNFINAYNERFGDGAAQLEIARAKRREARGG